MLDEIKITVFALSVIGILAVIAVWMWWKVFKLEKYKKEQEAILRKQQREKRDYIIESVQIIARNVVSEDLNISEAAIRLKVLLDNLMLPEDERLQFQAVDILYEKVKGFDTHQTRKELPKQERMRQDKYRMLHEAEHREQILAVAELIVEYDFPRLH